MVIGWTIRPAKGLDLGLDLGAAWPLIGDPAPVFGSKAANGLPVGARGGCRAAVGNSPPPVGGRGDCFGAGALPPMAPFMLLAFFTVQVPMQFPSFLRSMQARSSLRQNMFVAHGGRPLPQATPFWVVPVASLSAAFTPNESAARIKTAFIL